MELVLKEYEKMSGYSGELLSENSQLRAEVERLQEERDRLHHLLHDYLTPEELKEGIKTKEIEASLRADLAAAVEKYNELIMQVSNKYPGETRYETALKYLRERENQSQCCPGKPNIARPDFAQNLPAIPKTAVKSSDEY